MIEEGRADLGGGGEKVVRTRAEEGVKEGGPTAEVDTSCSKLEDQQQEIHLAPQHSVSSSII